MQRFLNNFFGGSGCNTTTPTNSGNGNGNGNGTNTELRIVDKIDIIRHKLPNKKPEDLRKYCIHSSMRNSFLQTTEGEWVGIKSNGDGSFFLFCTVDLNVIIILQWDENPPLCIPKRVEITDDDMVEYTLDSNNISEASGDIILIPCENKSFILFSPKLKKCVFLDSNFEVEKQESGKQESESVLNSSFLKGKFSTPVIEIKHMSGFDCIFSYICSRNVHQKQGDEEQNQLSAKQFVEGIIKAYQADKSQ